MKIALTGGAGFIGSHIADAYLEQGHEVVIIDNLSTGRIENINPKAEFIEIDINSDKLDKIFEEEKFDIVNHQAAQIDVRISVRDPKLDAKTNILGSLNLYEACKNNGVKKIIFSSTGGAIYGEQDYFPADEEHPLRPCSPYGIAKLVNEKYLFYYKEIYGIDHVILRYANVYGPRQNPFGEAGVIAIFINKMLNGEQPVINGDGKNTRDYVYVSDIVNGNLIALNNDVSGIFNLGTSIEYDVNFIFKKLNEILDSNFTEYHGEAKLGEQKRSVISYEKIQKKFGWKPEIELIEGLSKTIDFFKK
ncbi:MAG: NAD-dependent epimerase/dehydratase family protein [bacterium]